MKKSIIALALFALTSCTQNQRVKTWGGNGVLNLPAGQKLITMTWKEAHLWYLTEKMDSAYKPKTYTFKEESNWGFQEGTYIVIESK